MAVNPKLKKAVLLFFIVNICFLIGNYFQYGKIKVSVLQVVLAPLPLVLYFIRKQH